MAVLWNALRARQNVYSIVISYPYSAQVWQFQRRFDECQPWNLNTDLVQLHSVWSVSRHCTQWNNSLSVLPGQPTTVQIRHRSDTITEGPLRRLWNRSVCKRYENVEYSDIYHPKQTVVISRIRWRTPSDCNAWFSRLSMSYLVKINMMMMMMMFGRLDDWITKWCSIRHICLIRHDRLS